MTIFAVAAVVITAHVIAYQKISPFDEGVHFDYVVKAARGEIVQKGEKLGQQAMREIACRGIDLRGLVLPPCDSLSFDPEAFPNEGFNSADIHTPVYYGITGGLARGLVASGVAADMFTAARLAGILWLGLGLLLIWYAGKELGVATAPLAVVIGAVAATPTLLHASATVTNDTAGLVAGGLLMLVTLRWERGRSPLWLLGLVAFLALALKTTNILAVGLCALYLLLRPRTVDPPPPRTSNRAGLAVILGSAGLALAVWVGLHAIMAKPVVIPIDDPGGGLQFLNVLANLTTLITPVSYGLPTAVLGEIAFWAIGGFLGVLMIGATVAPVLRGSFSERWERLAGSAGITMLLGGALFALASYALYGEVIVSPRYGISLIPALAVALAAAIRWRPAIWGLWVFAVGQLALVLSALVSA